MLNLKYLVTGTGRCGTAYMARLLSNLDIPCSHEAVFNYNGLSIAKKVIQEKIPVITSWCSRYDIKTNKKITKWLHTDKIEAESSYMSAPFLQEDFLSNTKIIHLVRNPLKVISSFVLDIKFFSDLNSEDHYLKFVKSHLPELHDIKTEIERACFYYVKWNNIIEDLCQNKKHIIHKLENYSDENLFEFLNKKNVNIFSDVVNSGNKRTYKIEIVDIPEGKIKKDFLEIIEKYGY